MPKAILDRLLKHERAADLIALYAFYSYTGNWQGTNQPKANNKFVGKCLKWGRDKVPLVKSILVGMGLVEDVPRRNPKSGRAEGWFIKIRFFPQRKNHPTGFQWGGSAKNHPTEIQSLDLRPVGKTDTYACSPGTPLNASSPGSEEAPLGVDKRIHVPRNVRGASKRARASATASAPSPSFSSSSELKTRDRSIVRPPSLEECVQYGLEIGLPREECAAFFDHHSTRGWRLKGNLPMRDYKAALRTWQRNAVRFAKDDSPPERRLLPPPEAGRERRRYMASPQEQRNRRRALIDKENKK